jgi:hypothetical protein
VLENPDDAEEPGARIFESQRGFKYRKETADLVNHLKDDKITRLLLFGEHGQGKTMLAEAAFAELQKLRDFKYADFYRFRASSEDGPILILIVFYSDCSFYFQVVL